MNVTKIGFYRPIRTFATTQTQDLNINRNFVQNLSFGVEYTRDVYTDSKQDSLAKRRRCFTDMISAPPEPGEELSKFDKMIADNAALIGSFGKEGLPVYYKRADFVRNLYKILPSSERKYPGGFGIDKFVGKGLFKSPTGYDGILDPEELNLQTRAGRQIYDEISKFIYTNKVQTENKELNNTLNTLIGGMPEFVNGIGKEQSENHKYSLDIHSLITLTNIVRDPRYKTLSEDDKFVLKMTALLHDISKPEGGSDPCHPFASGAACRTFIKRYNLTPEMEERIIDHINNHQWLRFYNISNRAKKIINNQVGKYRSPEDYTMALIFTKADLAATSKKIYDDFSPFLENGPQKEMREAVEKKFGMKFS